MIKDKKLSLRLGILAGLVSISLIGATAGSLAWYAYSRVVTFSFIGTSVSSSSLLSVGLIDEDECFDSTDLATWDLAYETVEKGSEDVTVIFSKSRNGFEVNALRKYLTHYEYAVDRLYPVTSKGRAIDATGELQLFKAPESTETSFANRAPHSNYVYLPFVFKVDSDNTDYVVNKNIWITDSVVQAQRSIEDSIRVYVDGQNKFLMKPFDTENRTGSTKVGGLLDLDGDGYYDYNSSTNTEYCYGSFGSAPTISDSGYPNDEAHNQLVDINETGANTASTFLAKHRPGVLYATSFPNPGPDLAYYYSYGKVKPSVDGNGNYVSNANGGLAVARTGADNGYAFADFTIYIEGWDHSIIDSNAGYDFNLGLTFEVDRI